jgi:uncharacterized caspase-like protein
MTVTDSLKSFAAYMAASLFVCLLLAESASAEKRVALVLGNGAYRHAPHLPNPPNDSQDVAAALTRSGFEVIAGRDFTKDAMDEAIIRFSRAARNADVAMFYYSGHAMQFGGVNYLVPVDAALADEADLRRMIRVDEIVADLQQAKNLRILVLDSCRDNPLAEQLKRSIGATRALSVQRGLAKIGSPEGMIVSYATQSGRTAEDGSGRNSPYTRAFLKHIEAQDEIGTIFRRIATDVYESTRHEQLPELSLSLIGEFYLRGRVEAAASAKPTAVEPCAGAPDHWKSAEAIGSAAAFEDHLARFGNCAFAGLAKTRMDHLKAKAKPADAPPITRTPAANPSVALAPSTTAWPAKTPGYSEWLTPTEYQKLFDAMHRERKYPRIVEATPYTDAVVLLHAIFEPYPTDQFSFYSYVRMTRERFEQRNEFFRRDGYTLVHQQSVVVRGVELIQATWTRQ